jgi:hypothetical protein
VKLGQRARGEKIDKELEKEKPGRERRDKKLEREEGRRKEKITFSYTPFVST